MSSVPNQAPVLLSASGAVPLNPTPYTIYSIAATGIAALTLAAPPCDGIELLFVDETGFAHNIVCTGAGSPATAGLNSGTTNNKLLFNGTRGSAVSLVSRNGFWWTAGTLGVTVS